MADVTKHFRWGLSVRAILHHFSTPELRALLRHCRKLIKDFCNPAFEGEGYRAAIIAFEMYEYGFVLAYDHDAEEWVLNVATFPDWGSPHCRRRPPNNANNVERVMEMLRSLRRPDVAQLIEDARTMLRAARALVPMLRDYLARITAAIGVPGVTEMLRNSRIQQPSHQHASPIIEMFTRLAEQRPHDYAEVVQLVRAKVSSAVWFLGPLWTLPLPRLRPVDLELWDVSWFGALPEQASG